MAELFGFEFKKKQVEDQVDASLKLPVDELDGKDLDGRAINVSLARPKEDRPKRDFGGNDRGGNGGGSFRQRSW